MIRNEIIVEFQESILRNLSHVTHLAGMVAAGGVLAGGVLVGVVLAGGGLAVLDQSL